MSERMVWKMLHLLNSLKPGVSGLTAPQLDSAGVDFNTRAFQPLTDNGAVVVDGTGKYSLSGAARTILQSCVVANRRWVGDDMFVDCPQAFVVMPFGEDWSSSVFNNMISPAVEAAGFSCIRGDTTPRIGDLTATICRALMRAGLVVADVSVPNPNVFYKIGLTHALGKDCFILNHGDVFFLPTDIAGSHYYPYDLDNLDRGREKLQRGLATWATENCVEGVRNLEELLTSSWAR